MPGDRRIFVNQVRDMWSRLLWRRRLTIIGFGFLGLGSIGALVHSMNRIEYVPMYADLNHEDASAIFAKLEEKKIDCIVKGNTILVSPNQVDKVRLDSDISALAHSGRPGYELFDKNQFGMTDFTEQLTLKRALEGELARTIKSLPEISQASVHIVIPRDSVLSKNKEDVRASVVLTLKKNAELTKTSMAGIKNLVAGAVPDLFTCNISITESSANQPEFAISRNQKTEQPRH
jgi:flagellar M-ring protein FliF